MKISFIHMQIVVHLCVNKTNFPMKGFALGLPLKQRRKATQKLPAQISTSQSNPNHFNLIFQVNEALSSGID